MNKVKIELDGCCRTKVKSKAFAILTVFAFVMNDTIAVRIGIVSALELTFVL